MRWLLPSILSLLIFPAALAFDSYVTIENGRVTVTVSNAPMCVRLEGSKDLANWYPQTAIQTVGAMDSFTFLCPTNEQRAFWRVVPGSCCSLGP
jgi:hypothetical protein